MAMGRYACGEVCAKLRRARVQQQRHFLQHKVLVCGLAIVTGRGDAQVAEYVMMCGAHEYSDSVNSFSAWRTDQHAVHEPATAALLAPEAR